MLECCSVVVVISEERNLITMSLGGNKSLHDLDRVMVNI